MRSSISDLNHTLQNWYLKQSSQVRRLVALQVARKLDEELEKIEKSGGDFEFSRKKENNNLEIQNLLSLPTNNLVRDILKEFVKKREWFPEYYRAYVATELNRNLK